MLPNWKCSVGVYWHGIIPRKKKRKKKKKEEKGKKKKKKKRGQESERNLTAHFFLNPMKGK